MPDLEEILQNIRTIADKDDGASDSPVLGDLMYSLLVEEDPWPEIDKKAVIIELTDRLMDNQNGQS